MLLDNRKIGSSVFTAIVMIAFTGALGAAPLALAEPPQKQDNSGRQLASVSIPAATARYQREPALQLRTALHQRPGASVPSFQQKMNQTIAAARSTTQTFDKNFVDLLSSASAALVSSWKKLSEPPMISPVVNEPVIQANRLSRIEEDGRVKTVAPR